MLHSIRWRLIISYTALTLLTILLIGIVALSFASRYMDVREHETLWINAQAVARMARPHLVRPDQKARLQQLALSAGFLTNTELKILNADRRILAFSQQGPSHYDTVPNMMTLLSEVSPGRCGFYLWGRNKADIRLLRSRPAARNTMGGP